MAKEGLVRAKSGWNVFIDGKEKGWFSSRTEASLFYKSSKEKLNKPKIEKYTVEGDNNSSENVKKGTGKKMSMPNFSTFFRYLIKGFIVIAVIGALVLLGMLIFNASRTGVLEVYTDNVVTNLDETVDQGGFFAFFKKQWDYIQDPSKINTYQSVVENNQENRNLGVKIVNFEANRQSDYFENDDVRGIAVVQAASLSDDFSEVVFGCELEDYHGSDSVKPRVVQYFGNGRVERWNVGCDFEGNKISLSQKTLNPKDLTFTATFEAFTIAHYNVYLMERGEFERIAYDLGKSPFDYYEINEPLLGIADTMTSTTTAGPVNLAIGTDTSQPFTTKGYSSISGIATQTYSGLDGEVETTFADSDVGGETGGSYYFQVAMSAQERDGKIKKVNSLKLKVPKEIRLIEDRRNCDFVATGEYDGGYSIYELTEYAFNEKVNKDCSSEALEGTGMTELNCMKDFKDRGVQLQCFFEIPEFSEEWGDIVKTSFVAELDYIYEKEKKESITIRRSSTSDSRVDPCSYILKKEECEADQGCKPSISGDSFEGCVSCTENYCSDYKTEGDCKSNYCLSGNCIWSADECKPIAI